MVLRTQILSLGVACLVPVSLAGPTWSNSTSCTRNSTSPTPNVNGTASCTSTVTVTSIFTYTPAPVTETVATTSTDYILGDDGIPVDPRTVPFYVVSTIIDNSTLSFTYSTTITPTEFTTTIPAPTAFVAVKDTLPSATYLDVQGGYNPVGTPFPAPGANPLRKRDCITRTITSQSTTSAEPSTTTITITSTEGWIIWYAASTSINVISYPTNVEPTRTTTVTYTSYPNSFYYTTSTIFGTETVKGSTTTVYAACATENFANAIAQDNDGFDDSYDFLNSINGSIPLITDFDGGSAYDCCVKSYLNGGRVWWWGWDRTSRQGCAFYRANGTSNTCDGEPQSALPYTANTGDGQRVVMGNGPCGQVTVAGPGPAIVTL